MADFENRYSENAPGAFYVDDTCLDCDLCRETAPSVFHRNDESGFSYVAKQPLSQEEIALCQEAFEGCPCESIGNDGNDRDWSGPTHANPLKDPELRKSCSHCRKSSGFLGTYRSALIVSAAYQIFFLGFGAVTLDYGVFLRCAAYAAAIYGLLFFLLVRRYQANPPRLILLVVKHLYPILAIGIFLSHSLFA